jgi:nicotinamidase-related amidase
MAITPSDSVFVIVDIQGKLARITQAADTLFANVRILVQGMKLLGVPVIVTEQYPQGLGHTVEEVAQELGGIPVIEKMAFSCCGEPAFMQALLDTGRHNVILCGIETHVCVYQTARDLIAAGFVPHLVTDAVSSRSSDNRQLGIHRIEMMGGVLTSVEMVLFELLKESGTANFKAISKLVK